MLGVKALLIGEKMTDLNQSLIPLCEATWELDRTEGHAINEIKETHTSPISEPPIEVPEDLKKNLAVTSVCLLYTSPSPRDRQKSRMPSSA